MKKRRNVFTQVLIYLVMLTLVFSPFQSFAAVAAAENSDSDVLTVTEAIANNEGTATVEVYCWNCPKWWRVF
ncbi:hypothetical protein [Bacillus sp. JCM 19034]|uniref:hypothetical protein n=1 Tax=Bacillus sp. JCM 19034 TaxID=1481928 RepID=UPI0007852EE9|nr:hypothetical protein [Bacillus sp. JCM 19034]